MERKDPGNSGRSWQAQLVMAIEHAAEGGWQQTLRMIALLAITAMALALIVMASR